MALIKEKEVKGYIAQYWKITTVTANIMNWTLSCSLSLFRDKDVREQGIQNQLDMRSFSWDVKDEIEKLSNSTMLELIEFAYNKIVESKSSTQPVYNDDGSQKLDDSGNPVTKTIELNWFADAVSDIETTTA